MTLTKNSSVKEILESYKSQVWPIIDSSLSTPNFPRKFTVPKAFENEIDYYWKIARDYPERKGKYVRPTVLIITCLALGGKLEDVLQTAAAMQLSEEWILVQDDWEDQSPQRRGKQSLHLLYPEKLAINASAGMQVVMWDILNKNFKTTDTNTAMKIMTEFHLMLTRTVMGQHVDINFVETNKMDYTDEDWFFIADSKTSYYTVAGPIRLGAICAGANNEQLEHLTNFGVNLGRCFQLVDDLLDVTSDFSGLKQLGNDIYESKRTLILGHLLRSTDNKDNKKLQTIISKKREEKSKGEVDWIIRMMHEYESIKYAKKLANKYKTRADEILENDLDFLKTEPHRSHLKTLTTFILNRDH